MKHFDSLQHLSTHDIEEIFRISSDLKMKLKQGERPPLLAGHVMSLLFEKPSLRTRLSFEAAMVQLGGSSLFLSAADAGLNGRESFPDVVRVLSSYSDCIVVRAFSQSMIEEAARHSSCPVINGLSDVSHPCQALADVFTIQESFGTLAGKTVTFVGDGNNVASSLAFAAMMMKMKFIMSSPPGYEFKSVFLKQCKELIPGASIKQISDPAEAVAKADIVYTDVWASMGQEAEAAKRKRVFTPYQVNEQLMAAAPSHARFMHCLPARRGMEVVDEVIDGHQSIAFEQAENRLHLAKGVLVWLLGKESRSQGEST